MYTPLDCAEKFVGKSQRLKVTYRLKVVNYATGGFEASVCTRAFSNAFSSEKTLQDTWCYRIEFRLS